MSLLEIVTLPNAILRQKVKPVTQFDDDLQTLIDDMIETMREANGVGLAAPQVGENRRLAIIESLPKVDDEGVEIPDSRELFVIINPDIVWASRGTEIGVEGCLSIPGYLGEVERSESVRVCALDRHGKKVKLRIRGWTARIFQHEIDHLNGVLFIDKLTAPENLWTEEAFYAQLDEEESAESAAEIKAAAA
ncbi:MAG: peptide deformylase [Chloroflexi bacterium]|nr:MAG: peptide deformylase [Chloroflexota bacterium]PIE81873.1 MAG: peptide deformylase [Chloroflexota bacterium]